jgi:hypothetical protein
MSDLVAELTELNRAFATAEFAADAEFFRCHLADALLFRRANGKVVDKVTFLKDLATPGNTNERLDTAGIEVLPCGDDLALCSVLIHSRVHVEERRSTAYFEILGYSCGATPSGGARSGSTPKSPSPFTTGHSWAPAS